MALRLNTPLQNKQEVTEMGVANAAQGAAVVAAFARKVFEHADNGDKAGSADA